MNANVVSILFAAVLLLGMILLLEVGRRLGRRHLGREEEGGRAGLGALEGAVFGLMGLLIAFTFSGAASRFDDRRQMIIKEANAIGTAWLRLDLLPAAAQPPLRDSFRRYLDARLATYQKIPDWEAVRRARDQANAMQEVIWTGAVAACREAPSPLTAQEISALNEMFDAGTARDAAAKIHPPAIIFVMLGVLALMSSLLAGYAMAGGKSRSWLHVLGFALILAITVYVILDLEYPRLGIIRINPFDQVLIELRQSMK